MEGFRGSLALVAVAIGSVALAVPAGAAGAPVLPQPVSLTAPARQYEPVVLTGQQFPDWSAGPEITARAPQVPTDYGVADPQGQLPPQLRSDCYQASPTPDPNGYVDPNHNDHNCYQSSQLPVRTLPGRTGIDTRTLLGYRWNTHAQKFVQIPFQVDTKWQHYITNNASGFAFYSGVDQVTTYTFDREGFRFTTNKPFDPANPAIVCQSQPAGGVATTPDPNPGLIDTDEMAFMARDAGPAAPSGATLPRGIVDARQVAVLDPITQQTAYVYVMRSGKDASGNVDVGPEYTAANSPYVHYQRDANAGLFVYSQSSYGNYGNAPKGPVCNPDGTPSIGRGFKRDAGGNILLDPSTYVQRRPLENATVTTPRYRFRYDGRWVMDDLRVSPDDTGPSTGDYGPNLIDRWKARAFQQSPGGNTPCCGYEEEATNWGGSSQLMGEKVGPVRDIRVTWGADSSTNNVRTEIFYPEMVMYQDELRVHVIPPFDGIYVQRDMAAGRITRYYNNYLPQGAPVDGINDEAFGNFNAHVGPDGVSIDSADTFGQTLRSLNNDKPLSVGVPNPNNSLPLPSCDAAGNACLHGDFDVSDVAFSGPPGTLQWEEMDGPYGATVERWNIHQVTPVGTPLAAIATYPYYRDDSCFDDGTGNDPGPKLHLRSKDEPTTWGYDPVTGVPMSPAPAGASPVYQRRCWNHHPDGSPYNIPGTLTYDSSKPAETPDPAPNPSFSPQGDVRYFQGDVGTHGLHVEFIADSDNAQVAEPIDEIDTEQRQVLLHGNQGNVGEQYGHSFDKPLVAVAEPGAFGTPASGAPGNGGGGNGSGHGGNGAGSGAQGVTTAQRGDGSSASAAQAAAPSMMTAARIGATTGAAALGGWSLVVGPILRRRRRRVR
jgi:hypothetical protein